MLLFGNGKIFDDKGISVCLYCDMVDIKLKGFVRLGIIDYVYISACLK